MSYPIAVDEVNRLQTLAPYQALGMQPEAEFDRITALAARLFRSPVALVILLDGDWQHYKSHYGTDLCGRPRDVAFCNHALALAEGELLVVSDATLDPRFADNPLVTGHAPVRFYAGAPLRAPNGHALGTLCVIDTVPHPDLTAEERATLIDLAAVVMETFRLNLTRRRAEKEAAERLRAENALRESEGRIRTVLESITDAFYSVDRAWRFTYVNDQAARILGRSREQLLGRVLWEEFIQAPDSVFYREFHRARDTGRRTDFEEYSRTIGGWVSVHAYPSTDGLSVYFQDITARRRQRRELEDSHALLRAVIDGTGDAVFLKDRKSRYVLINPAGAAILGRPAAEIIGRDDAEFCSPEIAQRMREKDLSVLESGVSCTYEETDLVAGVLRAFLTTKSPYRDAAGNLVGIIGVSRDITAQRQDAETLRDAKDEAEKANNAKSDFLSRMSHELRTPLNAILGFGQLLELGDLNPLQIESVEHILRAGRHLLNLIDEVLAIARIEAGRMRLSLEAVSLNEVVGECLGLVGRLAQDRRVTCEPPCWPDGAEREVFVLADRQRLLQVLLNLLSNAVKYNRQGGRVSIHCRELTLPAAVSGAEPSGAIYADWVHIEVSDTGMGLSAVEIEKLFTPFERLGADDSKTEGTGLGLALSKNLVEAMGGRINVYSTPGEGSTFRVELPLAEHPSQQIPSEHSRRPDGGLLPADTVGTVLYIEDNLSNMRLIQSLLRKEKGVTLLGAEQGTLGIEIARARLPDLILLDLHLPDQPGWEVLAHLRADAATRDIPVVIISADATPGRIARLRAGGAQDYLTKPIDVRELLRVLCEYLPTIPAEIVGAGI